MPPLTSWNDPGYTWHSLVLSANRPHAANYGALQRSGVTPKEFMKMLTATRRGGP